jgi:hypothetical protein
LGQTYAHNQIVYITPANPTEELRNYEKKREKEKEKEREREQEILSKHKNSEDGIENGNANGLSEDTEKSEHDNNVFENHKKGRGKKSKNNHKSFKKKNIDSNPPPPIPYLWGAGRMGGRARIAKWGPCGGRGSRSSWHGDRYCAACMVWCV